jgi:formiminoglutamase
MNDPRIGESIVNVTVDNIGDDTDIVIVGFPFDEGVSRNGGRPGARDAPDNLRSTHLKRCGTLVNLEKNIDSSNIKIGDVGNIDKTLGFDDAHTQLRNTVKSVINSKNHPVPFVFGGGNDQSFSNAMGLLESDIVKDGKRVAVINIDAHLDVRERKNDLEHSGTPFRLLLEQSNFDGKNFVEFAAQGTQCSVAHSEFVTKQHGGRIFWLSHLYNNTTPIAEFRKLLQELSQNCDHIFVSFDLDSVSGEHAPGVSCPSPIGISAQDALDICFIAGQCDKVSLVDLSEYNPQVEGYRTGKLVANMFIQFVMGFTSRSRKQK